MTERIRVTFKSPEGRTMAEDAQQRIDGIRGPRDRKIDPVEAMRRFNAARTDRKPNAPQANGK